MMTTDLPTDAPSAAEILFREVQKYNSTLAALVSAFSPLQAGFGLNRRIGGRRVSTLRGTKKSTFLAPRLRQLSARDLTAFIGLALVNKEQAEAAFRYTAIVNFTAPITVIVLINQLLPGGFAPVLETLEPYLLNIYVFSFILLGLSIFYVITISQGGVQLARDVYHMALIEQSRRGGSGPPSLADDAADTLDSSDL